MFRWSIMLIAFILAGSFAEAARVTVVTKEHGRLPGNLSLKTLKIETDSGNENVPIGNVVSVEFGQETGETDVIRTARQSTHKGKGFSGTIQVEGWVLRSDAGQVPLEREKMRFIVRQIGLDRLKPKQIFDAAAANGMTYHVRLPEQFDPQVGWPAIVLFHGANENAANYLQTVVGQWPRLAKDYVLIGINGEWPTQKNPARPPGYVYTYVNFVGKGNKYQGFPGTDRESPALVAEVIHEIKKSLTLTKVFIVGHSQGGYLAYSCIMNFPELFAGAVPVSGGLIIQCEPTAYVDPQIRERQRKLPIAIVHGQKDEQVPVELAESAYASLEGDGFPMVRLLLRKNVNHAFMALPIDQAVKWLEEMTSDDPVALLEFANKQFAAREYRDAWAALRRASEIDRDGQHNARITAVRGEIEKLAAAAARPLEAAMRQTKDDSWVAEFSRFRRQFEFTESAKPIMEEFQKLRVLHEPLAEKLWFEARAAFQKGEREEGYRLCEDVVNKYFASTFYRYAKKSLDERR